MRIQPDEPIAASLISASMPLWRDEPALRLLELEGEEAVGSPFRYRLLARDRRSAWVVQQGKDYVPRHGESDRTDANALLGQELGVCLELEAGIRDRFGPPVARWRCINGIVTGLRHLDTDARGRMIELRLEPWLALARLRNHYRIFQHQRVPDILRTVLGAYPWRLDMRCGGEYPKLDYQVQYGETDFDFVVRLMARWGLSYYFEHADGDPRKCSRAPAHTLVIRDPTSGLDLQPCPAYRELPLRARRDAPGERDRPVVHAFDTCLSLHGEWTEAWDYDFQHPQRRLVGEARAQVPHNVPTAERHTLIHWPAGFDASAHDAKVSDHLARVRQYQAERGNFIAQGQGALRGLRPGYRFDLDGHSLDSHNRTHFVTSTRLRIRVPEDHGDGREQDRADEEVEAHCEFETRCAYRLVLADAPRDFDGQLRKPRIHGVQTARVIGPSGHSVHTDQHGRIKVWFPWDRAGERKDDCSCWIRVASPASGGAQGYQGVPRIGQEVIVAFEHGDPDRPLVLGCVNGPDNPPNWDLPGQVALSGWRSRELAGGRGNWNTGRSSHLSFDDTHGQIQTQLACDHAYGALSMGRITRIAGSSGRQEARGDGFELRSDAFGAVRAAAGLSLSTDARLHGVGRIDDMQESRGRLLRAAQQQRVQARAVEQTGLQENGEQQKVAASLQAAAGRTPAPLPARALGEDGQFQPMAYDTTPADLNLGAAASLHANAHAHAHVTAGVHLSLSSGGHTSLSAGGSLLASAAQGLRLFAWQAGLRLMAFGGDVDIRALRQNIRIWARLRLEESAEHISIRADKELLLQGGPSALRLDARGVCVQAEQLQVHARLDLSSPRTLGVGARGEPELQEFMGRMELTTPAARRWGGLRYRLLPEQAQAADPWEGQLHTTPESALTPEMHTEQEARWLGELELDHLHVEHGPTPSTDP